VTVLLERELDGGEAAADDHPPVRAVAPAPGLPRR
jgi:hypothetical protein